jgi:YVTN family beta-propeller protein
VNEVTLGDVAQSITVRKGLSYIVVNNSGLIYCIDNSTAEFKGKISGLTSPRNLLLINDQKAYVSDLFNKSLTIVNPSTYEITGVIPLNRTSEEMALVGTRAYIANWSAYGQDLKNDVLLVVDTQIDTVIDTIKVGIEPNSVVKDKDQNIWVLCSGGYMNEEKPSLWKIAGATGELFKTYTFDKLETNPMGMKINGSRDQIYFLNNGIYKMSVDDGQLPSAPFIDQDNNMVFSCLGIDPKNGDLYAGNPLDYQSNGIVYHFLADGSLMDEISVGIAPGAFGFNY